MDPLPGNDLRRMWQECEPAIDRKIAPVFCFRPDKTSDCVLVRTPLLTPQGGTLIMHMDNSFISTTMCDDLARATEAQDGKK